MTKVPLNHIGEERASSIAASQNLLFDLVESQAEANAFNHGPRRPGRAVFLGIHIKTYINTVDLTIGGPWGLTLDFKASRPAELPIPEDQCTIAVGVYCNKPKQSEKKLEDHVFVPMVNDQNSVLWQDRDGTSYTPQQLCDFAFQRLHENAN